MFWCSVSKIYNKMFVLVLDIVLVKYLYVIIDYMLCFDCINVFLNENLFF